MVGSPVNVEPNLIGRFLAKSAQNCDGKQQQAQTWTSRKEYNIRCY
jgi:hypothetical protein